MPSRTEPYFRERLWVHSDTELDVDAARAQETYEYDADGRLTVIHESPDLWMIAGGGERLRTGGRLELEYDERGLVRIGDAWQRLDEPFEDFLARGVADLEQGVVQTIAEHGEPGTRAYALALVYVDQGSLVPTVELGREEDRPFDEAYEALYPESLGFPDVEAIDEDLARDLLMHAAIEQPANPYRFVLAEVCRRLARRDWGGLIVPTEDFVVFCAEHDEDVEPKIEMIREVNPPERVRLWEPVFAAIAEEDEF